MTTRADRIFEILRSNGPRMKVARIVDALSNQEGASDMRKRLSNHIFPI